jgi:hypothetical protein
VGDDERRDDGEGERRDRPYTYRDWQADGFRGPPPWRRGYQPWYWVLSIAVAALVLAAVLLLGPGR